MKSRKGISPLITTLLLIAIAAAASALIYAWVANMARSQEETYQPTHSDSLTMYLGETVTFNRFRYIYCGLQSFDRCEIAFIEYYGTATGLTVRTVLLKVQVGTEVMINGDFYRVTKFTDSWICLDKILGKSKHEN